jgi:2-dehydropantoate 2-reductase
MRICIFGAGAVGGHLAVKLAAAGHEVSCVMRGAHLAATQVNGLTLEVGDTRTVARVAASDDPRRLGPQDLVISALKATSLAGLADGIGPLLGPRTAVVTAQNGIPWWYGQRLAAGRPATPDLGFLDPGGRLAAALPPERLIGGVIFSSNEVREPGLVVNDSPDRNLLVVGEIDDAASERVAGLRAALEAAGFRSPPVSDIRHVIWSKLTGNSTVSVLCMLTGKTSRGLTQDPVLRPVLTRLLAETGAVAAAHNPDFQRFEAGPGGPLNHKPSFLQDYELGRPMEVDALVTAPAAFARAAGLATPMLDLMAALAIQKSRDAGLYSPA